MGSEDWTRVLCLKDKQTLWQLSCLPCPNFMSYNRRSSIRSWLPISGRIGWSLRSVLGTAGCLDWFYLESSYSCENGWTVWDQILLLFLLWTKWLILKEFIIHENGSFQAGDLCYCGRSIEHYGILQEVHFCRLGLEMGHLGRLPIGYELHAKGWE